MRAWEIHGVCMSYGVTVIIVENKPDYLNSNPFGMSYGINNIKNAMHPALLPPTMDE